jgi:alpha-soluble NSF attachment protein
LHNAAKYAKELAEIYETDLNQFEDALYYYQKSADWYQAEDSIAYPSFSYCHTPINAFLYRTANANLLKVAALNATLEKYQEAIQTFDEIIKVALASQLTKYSVKDHMFKSLLCSLCLKVSTTYNFRS